MAFCYERGIPVRMSEVPLFMSDVALRAVSYGRGTPVGAEHGELRARRAALLPPGSLHPQPYTLNLQPFTLHPEP